MKTKETIVFSITLALCGMLSTSCKPMIINEDAAPGVIKTLNQYTVTCEVCGGSGREWRNYDEEFEMEKESFVRYQMSGFNYYSTQSDSYWARREAENDFSNAHSNRPRGQGYGPCRTCGGSGSCVRGNNVEVSATTHIYWTN